MKNHWKFSSLGLMAVAGCSFFFCGPEAAGEDMRGNAALSPASAAANGLGSASSPEAESSTGNLADMRLGRPTGR